MPSDHFRLLFSPRNLTCSLICTVIAIAHMAQADNHGEGDEFSLEEIIVSAERVDESTFEVPISVTSFDSDDLEDYQITNLKDLEVRVPGLQFGLDSPATIRGIGSLYRGVGGDVAVAQYVNDVFFDEPYGVISSMYDIERVEVLRGPQGTLYGRNSIAGAINYVHKRPDLNGFGGGALGEVASFNGMRTNGFVNVPLTDSIGFRLTSEWQSSDGNQENISGPDQGARGDYNVSPQLRFTNGRMDVNIRYARFIQDSASELRVPVRYPDIGVEFHANPQNGEPSEERNQFYLYPRRQPPSTSEGDLRNVIDMNNGGTTDVERDTLSMHIDYKITEEFGYRYILGVTELALGLLDQDCDGSSVLGSSDNRFLSNTALSPYQDCTIRASFTNDITSNELQLTYDNEAFSALLGFYMFQQTAQDEYRLYDQANRAAGISTEDAVPLRFIFGDEIFYPDPSNQNEFFAGHVADGSYQNIHLASARGVDSNAVYTQASYQLDDKWQLTAGARYTKDDKESLYENLWAVLDFDEDPFNEESTPARFNQISDGGMESFRKFTGNVSLEYAPDENRLTYVRLSTGYRSGGLAPDAPPPYDTFEDEDLTAVEVGYKADLYDDTVRLLVSSYYYSFDNYQQPITVRLFEPTTFEIGVITNLPNTTLFGAEVEGTWIINDAFSLSGYYAFQTSSLGELYSADPVNPDQEFELVTTTSPVTGQTSTTFLGTQVNLEGNELPNMPNNKFSVTGKWRHDLGDRGQLFVNATYSFTGERFNRIYNIPNDRLDSYSRVDTSATWRSADGKLSVSAFIENVLDQIGIMELESNGWDAGYYQDATLTDPRFLGLVVNWTY